MGSRDSDFDGRLQTDCGRSGSWLDRLLGALRRLMTFGNPMAGVERGRGTQNRRLEQRWNRLLA